MRRPVALITSKAVLVGLQVMAGAGALSGIIGERWFGLFALLVAAASACLASLEHELFSTASARRRRRKGDTSVHVQTKTDTAQGDAGL